VTSPAPVPPAHQLTSAAALADLTNAPASADLSNAAASADLTGVPASADLTGAPAFADLTGQDAVVAQLSRASAAAAALLAGHRPDPGAMTHAWLFTGPPGSGRSIAARSFAAALLCPSGGCGECSSCRQVQAGTHADLLLVRPEGLSYGVRQTRELVLRAAGAPAGGRWHVVVFEDADRCTEQAANALLKAIEEPTPRTVWLLCAPSAEDLVPTIRSRCRVVTLVVPASSAVAKVLVTRDGIEPAAALAAARAAQGHVGRARRLAVDASAAARRADVLRVPTQATSLGPALSAAASLVRTAEDEAKAVTEELDEPERMSLRRAFGEGSTGKGVAKAMRGMAGAVKDLEDRQKSRATRVKRDTLDQALLDLAVFYRDVLMLQLGVDVELANGDREPDLRQIASSSTPESTLRRLQAVMRCRERLPLNVAPLLAVEDMTLSLVAG
jgi:DNA polymerase III subunit delta'